MPIQAKLTVNHPGDIYEQEADAVAGQVMRMPAPAVQRQCACGRNASEDGEYEECRTRRLGLQRKSSEELTSANAVQRNAAPSGHHIHEPAVIYQQAACGLTGPSERLPNLNTIQSSFGYHSLEGVRVHIGGPAAGASQAIDALAYTVGNDVRSGSHLIFAP